MEPNIILIVCDSLRKDIMELYGGKAKTPNLIELSKDSMVYENCVAPSPWTFPSHVSLFTGLYLNEHGVHETEDSVLLDLSKPNINLKAERLAEYLYDLGYNTLGISNNPMVSATTGFDIGFNNLFFIDPFPINKEDPLFKEAKNIGASPLSIAIRLIKSGNFKKLFEFYNIKRKEKLTSKALNFPLDKGASLTNRLLKSTNIKEKSFIFINFMEVHEPYRNYNSKKVWDNITGIKKLDKKFVDNVRKEYLKEMEYLDYQIGLFIKHLKNMNLYDDSLIIVTSDHGQALNEHGYLLHKVYLYEELTRIPLIIKYPKNKKFENKNGYQSLISIKNLIKSVIQGGDDSQLYLDKVFSEAYGADIILPGGYKGREKYIKDTYEKRRKAVYKDGFKLTVNGTDGKIEEFMKDGKNINLEDNKNKVNELLEEIEIFKGKEDFKIPYIN